MATKAETKPDKKADEKKPEERRIPELAVNMFVHLGFSIPLPDGLVETYKEFKAIANKVQPGAGLTREGYAMVVMLYRMREPLKG